MESVLKWSDWIGVIKPPPLSLKDDEDAALDRQYLSVASDRQRLEIKELSALMGCGGDEAVSPPSQAGTPQFDDDVLEEIMREQTEEMTRPIIEAAAEQGLKDLRTEVRLAGNWYGLAEDGSSQIQRYLPNLRFIGVSGRPDAAICVAGTWKVTKDKHIVVITEVIAVENDPDVFTRRMETTPAIEYSDSDPFKTIQTEFESSTDDELVYLDNGSEMVRLRRQHPIESPFEPDDSYPTEAGYSAYKLHRAEPLSGEAAMVQVTCKQCGRRMKKKTAISSGNCLGILLALVMLFSGLFITVYFFWTLIAPIIGVFLMLAALFMGGKRQRLAGRNALFQRTYGSRNWIAVIGFCVTADSVRRLKVYEVTHLSQLLPRRYNHDSLFPLNGLCTRVVSVCLCRPCPMDG